MQGKRNGALAALLSFLVLGAWLSPIDAAEKDLARSGADSLKFELFDIFGRKVCSEDYAGVPLFLEFGACW